MEIGAHVAVLRIEPIVDPVPRTYPKTHEPGLDPQAAGEAYLDERLPVSERVGTDESDHAPTV